MRPVTFMFELDDEHMPAVGDAAFRLHGALRQGVVHDCDPPPDEPLHVAVIRADVATVGEVLERAERLRIELVRAAKVPDGAVQTYAIC